jgi:hypothetical protein
MTGALLVGSLLRHQQNRSKKRYLVIYYFQKLSKKLGQIDAILLEYLGS